MKHRLPLILSVVVAAAAAAWNAAAAETLITLDGKTVTAAIASIDAQGRILAANGDALPPLQSLRSIRRTDAAPAAESPMLLWLIDDGRIHARDIAMKDGVITAQVNDKLSIELPLALAAGLCLGAGKSTAIDDTFMQAMAKPSAEQDQLYLKAGENLQAIGVAVESVRDGSLTFTWSGKTQTAKPDRIYGVVFARTREQADLSGRCNLHLANGSRFWARVEGLADGTVVCRLDAATTLRLPWSAVTHLDIRSDRVRFLSDMEPTRVEQTAWVTLPFPWQRDKSVYGKPLTVNKQVYSKGIGVHSISKLTFACDPAFPVFAAAVGIDDETRGAGDCDVLVLGDGKELYKQRIRGGEAVRDVRLDLAGVRELTLVVEAGEELDIADHLNWCEARFEAAPAAR
jgi:hypothetical protein